MDITIMQIQIRKPCERCGGKNTFDNFRERVEKFWEDLREAMKYEPLASTAQTDLVIKEMNDYLKTRRCNCKDGYIYEWVEVHKLPEHITILTKYTPLVVALTEKELKHNKEK